MTVTVTPTAQPTNVPPRIQLAVTTTTETSTTIVRNNPDNSLSIVRTSDGGPLPVSGGAATIYDYEAPFGAPVTYSSYESPTTVSGSVTVAVTQPWLIHPGVPALSQPIDLVAGSLTEEVFPIQRGVFYPMGRSSAVVVTDTARKGPESSITIQTSTTTQLASIQQLLVSGSALLLNIPTSLGFGDGASYIAVGDVKVRRASTYGGEPVRFIDMPFVTVNAPSGGTQAQRTYADLLNYATYGALRTAYSSYAALLAGP